MFSKSKSFSSVKWHLTLELYIVQLDLNLSSGLADSYRCLEHVSMITSSMLPAVSVDLTLYEAHISFIHSSQNRPTHNRLRCSKALLLLARLKNIYIFLNFPAIIFHFAAKLYWVLSLLHFSSQSLTLQDYIFKLQYHCCCGITLVLTYLPI